MRGWPVADVGGVDEEPGALGRAHRAVVEHLLDDGAQRVEVAGIELVGREHAGDGVGGDDAGRELEHSRGEGGRRRDGAQPVDRGVGERAVETGDAEPEGFQPFAGAVVAAEHPAVLERRGVHRAGGGGGDAFDLDAVLFEQAVERAPGEGAVRAAALQRQRHRLLGLRAGEPPDPVLGRAASPRHSGRPTTIDRQVGAGDLRRPPPSTGRRRSAATCSDGDEFLRSAARARITSLMTVLAWSMPRCLHRVGDLRLDERASST